MRKDFVNLADFDGGQLEALLRRAIEDKKLFKGGRLQPTLVNKTLAMIFQKASLRTRVSFETAMTHLGGHAIYLSREDIGLGKREPIKDIARVLGRMCDGIMARTFSHEHVEQLAEFADVPVVNALSDYSHPCQAMADLMTVMERRGSVGGLRLAFIGDGNNVARSLAVACSRLGMSFTLACPEGYDLDFATLDISYRDCDIVRDAASAAAAADVVYTDTWVSMGQEEQREERLRDFAGFQVNVELLASARDDVIVLHCLPAYRGREITDEAFEAHASSILDQSENRLHFQRSLLNVLMAEGGVR